MIDIKKHKYDLILARILAAIFFLPMFISSCQTIQHVDRSNYHFTTDTDIRNIEENTECTTIADNIVGSSETIPQDQILFPNLPTQSINLIFEPRLVEGASDLLRDDNQGNRIRPLMAIDANTLLLQAWDGSTGYIDELFLVDQDTTKSIYKRDFVYSSLYVHRPTYVDKQNRELTLVVSKEGTEEVFSYNLDTDKLQVIEKRRDANELLEEEKSRYALRINADHIWEVFERSNPDVVLFKEIRSPSLLEAADGLLIRDANREKHFYWDGQSLYQFPREINGNLVLAIDLALDGTIYAYTRTGERETFGLSPLLETQQIWRYE